MAGISSHRIFVVTACPPALCFVCKPSLGGIFASDVSPVRTHFSLRLTFNEPWCSAVLGYGNGEHAPGVTSPDASKVYRAGHNMLRAHAYSVDLYKRKFQPAQKGVIGITLNGGWTGVAACDVCGRQSRDKCAQSFLDGSGSLFCSSFSHWMKTLRISNGRVDPCLA